MKQTSKGPMPIALLNHYVYLVLCFNPEMLRSEVGEVKGVLLN